MKFIRVSNQMYAYIAKKFEQIDQKFSKINKKNLGTEAKLRFTKVATQLGKRRNFTPKRNRNQAKLSENPK